MDEEPTNAPQELQRLSLEEQQQLVMQYAPLVRKIARSLPMEIPGLLEFDDAVGYGTCGLVEAVRRFDPNKGTNFHAYAVQRIRGSIIDAFRRMDRLSRTMRQKALHGEQPSRFAASNSSSGMFCRAARTSSADSGVICQTWTSSMAAIVRNLCWPRKTW